MDESYKQKIQTYLSGDMNKEESLEVEKLLAGSLEIQNYTRDSQSIWNMLDTVDDISPDDNYIAKFWDAVSGIEKNENKGVFNLFNLWKKKTTFAASFATFLIISAILVNFFVIDQGENNKYVYNKADEELLDNLDRAITLNTPEYLRVYGPWDE